MTFVVAWMDIGDQIGVCPRCVPGEIARHPAVFDVVPVTVTEAHGIACAECGEPLVGDARVGAEVLVQEWA